MSKTLALKMRHQKYFGKNACVKNLIKIDAEKRIMSAKNRQLKIGTQKREKLLKTRGIEKCGASSKTFG